MAEHCNYNITTQISVMEVLKLTRPHNEIQEQGQLLTKSQYAKTLFKKEEIK